MSLFSDNQSMGAAMNVPQRKTLTLFNIKEISDSNPKEGYVRRTDKLPQKTGVGKKDRN